MHMKARAYLSHGKRRTDLVLLGYTYWMVWMNPTSPLYLDSSPDQHHRCSPFAHATGIGLAPFGAALSGCIHREREDIMVNRRIQASLA